LHEKPIWEKISSCVLYPVLVQDYEVSKPFQYLPNESKFINPKIKKRKGGEKLI